MALDGAPMKSLLPGHTCLGSGYRTSPTNCDDPVHGSGPGEIVFRHMSVVQRGVRSRATTAEIMLSGPPCTSVSSTGSHCLLPVGGRTTPPNQVRLASSTGDDIRLLVRLDSLPFARRWTQGNDPKMGLARTTTMYRIIAVGRRCGSR
jgi:hypothetical protein